MSRWRVEVHVTRRYVAGLPTEHVLESVMPRHDYEFLAPWVDKYGECFADQAQMREARQLAEQSDKQVASSRDLVLRRLVELGKQITKDFPRVPDPKSDRSRWKLWNTINVLWKAHQMREECNGT
jgi:hypothetical protein